MASQMKPRQLTRRSRDVAQSRRRGRCSVSCIHQVCGVNASSMHGQLHTHVFHLCRWLDAGSAQHARGRRRVSTDHDCWRVSNATIHANSDELGDFWLFQWTTLGVSLPQSTIGLCCASVLWSKSLKTIFRDFSKTELWNIESHQGDLRSIPAYHKVPRCRYYSLHKGCLVLML